MGLIIEVSGTVSGVLMSVLTLYSNDRIAGYFRGLTSTSNLEHLVPRKLVYFWLNDLSTPGV